jgi:hypothetical protein
MIIQAKSTTLAVSLIVSTSLLSGCATTQQNQQLGGAAFGALAAGLTTGLLTGNVGYGIAAGIGGAALGWGAVKLAQHESRQVRSAREDERLYGFTPATNSVLLKLNKGYASPSSIAPGQQTTIYSDYSLSLPQSYNNQANVTYEWKLKKDGKVLNQSRPASQTKTAAGHQTIQPIDIPSNATPGTYVVETKLSSGNTYDVNEVVFVVR